MTSPRWKQLALLLAAALAVRLVAAGVWQSRLDGPFFFGDSENYWTLGRAIAQGQPYRCGPEQAEVFRTPGYPLLLSPIFVIAGSDASVIWGRVQNALLGTLAVAGVWCLAEQLFNQRAATVAAIIAAFYPGAVAVSVAVLSETPFCGLMLLQLVLWTFAWRAASPRKAAALAVAAGLVAGVATLVRPSWLLFTPIAVIVAAVVDTCRKRHLWVGGAMLAGLIVTMVPWWIRNARVTGRFVPTTLQVGASLYDGLNPLATGASDMSVVPKTLDAHHARLPGVENGSEFQLDRHCRTRALQWARSNPARVTQLAGIKVLRMWNIWPNEQSLSSWPVRLAMAFTYVPVMILAILGVARTIRCGWPYTLCWLPAIYFTALHAVFVSSIRYRQPAMLPLIVLAAGAITTRGREAKTRGTARPQPKEESSR